MTTIILALVIGAAFGFVLDRVGATNPGYIIGMLNLKNLHLMKTIVLAIGVASVLTFTGLLIGIIDPGHLSVKAAYIGVFVGGILLGVGFAISGYCPGTGLTAAATGRKDAMFFALGGLLGAAAYMGSYAWVETTGLLDKIMGGDSTLGTIAGTTYPALIEGVSGEWVGIVLGIALIVIASVLPARLIPAK
ncbi:MAG: YeeE/YedE family protein [Rhodospirillales bacterium]|nr:YeeE/YedE family protein [Rhodospirillales bacterium]